MEPESNAMPQCRSGCGFYGNPSQDGLCSVCYKDFLRKKQQPPVSSTPSSNNGPQPPASGQSVTASAVSLRSVVVTQQSLANSISNASSSSSSSSTTTTSASSASATSSSPAPSTCAAAANNPAVAVTNTAQPTVHSSLFCSDKDVKNKSAREGYAKANYDKVDSLGEINFEPDLITEEDRQIALNVGQAEQIIFELVSDVEDDPTSDSESDVDEQDVESDDLDDTDECGGVGSGPAASADAHLLMHKSLEASERQTCVGSELVNAGGSVANTRKRKLNTDDCGSLGGHSNNSSIADNDEKDGDKDDSKKKKNRCATCRKKVGLTGFECRCGGLFCAIHRYSDKHECSFDYRELGAAEIRRNNPVVVGEKIQKI